MCNSSSPSLKSVRPRPYQNPGNGHLDKRKGCREATLALRGDGKTHSNNLFCWYSLSQRLGGKPARFYSETPKLFWCVIVHGWRVRPSCAHSSWSSFGLVQMSKRFPMLMLSPEQCHQRNHVLPKLSWLVFAVWRVLLQLFRLWVSYLRFDAGPARIDLPRKSRRRRCSKVNNLNVTLEMRRRTVIHKVLSLAFGVPCPGDEPSALRDTKRFKGNYLAHVGVRAA